MVNVIKVGVSSPLPTKVVYLVFVLFLPFAPLSDNESLIYGNVFGKPNEENTLLTNINLL